MKAFNVKMNFCGLAKSYKQPSAHVLQNRFSKKFRNIRNIHIKTPMLESLLMKLLVFEIPFFYRARRVVAPERHLVIDRFTYCKCFAVSGRK